MIPAVSAVAAIICLCTLSNTSQAKVSSDVPPRGDTWSAHADTTHSATDGGAIGLDEEIIAGLVSEDSLWAEALRIHFNAIVMDGHVDTPSLMMADYDINLTHDSAHVDLPRMFEGGLDAPFFSIYVSGSMGESDQATRFARWMIDEVERQIRKSDGRAEKAETAADVRRITRSGKKAILLGMEGGHILQGSVRLLGEFRKRGIRYVTLTHTNTNSWADSSQDEPRWNGMNNLGRELVLEMNRLGILVDLSHVSDETAWDVLEITVAPPIASHSSARALVNSVRNLDDDLIRAIAEKGGVVMVNYFDLVVNPGLTEEVMKEVYDRIEQSDSLDLNDIWQLGYEARAERGIPRSSVEAVLDHIEYITQLVGIDHVGLGSDFDGATMPLGLEDVSRLPWITYGLLKRGYAEPDIYKILGGNTLRVLEAAEEVAEKLANTG
jgi:membrane dipeptidase